MSGETSPLVRGNHNSCSRLLSSTSCEDEVITLNVGGLKFQTRRSTLRRYPETLLGSDDLDSFYEPQLGEFFFDRNRTIFEPILGYYTSNGVICLPSSINPDIFVEELRFFKMGPQIISKFIVKSTNNESLIASYSDFSHPIQRKIWQLVDNPDSSLAARLIAYFDLFIILAAIIAQCVESLPSIRGISDEEKLSMGDALGFHVDNMAVSILTWIEFISNMWFTINFIARILSCPDKREFAGSVLNWFDILAILPFYLEVMLSHQQNLNFLMVLRFFRTLRIVRIFKMSRYFQGLFALGYALRSSAGELVILALMLVTFVVLFSSLIFFTDSCDVKLDENNPDNLCGAQPNQFDSVITGFWWSIITMSTVGYGDYVPKTNMGRVVGSMCALTGILVISLPFPLIITRFNNFMKLKSSGSSRYSTIDNGLCNEEGIVPEYNGVAFGFFSKDKTPRVAEGQSLRRVSVAEASADA